MADRKGSGFEEKFSLDDNDFFFILDSAAVAPVDKNKKVKKTLVAGGQVNEIIAGTNMQVDSSDPTKPIVSSSASTTAGILTRFNFTGDTEVTPQGTFFKTNTTDKGTIPSVQQDVINGDDQITFFAQDLLSDPLVVDTPVSDGLFISGLTVQVNSASGQQRFKIEIYRADNDGLELASGVAGAPVGDLGVTIIGELDSGIIDLVIDSPTNIILAGALTEDISILLGQRIRLHISAQKVGIAGGNVTQSVFYGQDHQSYLDVPTPVTSDGVINLSPVAGSTVTDALAQLDDTDLTTPQIGDVFYWNGTKIVNLPVGDIGQILETQGPGSAPVWVRKPITTLNFAYKADAIIGTPGGIPAGRIRWDNPTFQNLSSVIFISTTTEDGDPVDNILSEALDGDEFFLFGKSNQNEFQRWAITAVNNLVDRTEYFVTLVSQNKIFVDDEDMVLMLEFRSSGGGASTFDDLTDTPASKTGERRKIPKISQDELLLEYADGSEEVVFLVRYNQTIAKGEAVFAQGFDATAGTITVGLADNTVAFSRPAIGIANESGVSGEFKNIKELGIVTDLDTSVFSVGEKIYLSINGTLDSLINITGPKQVCGVVLVSSFGSGVLYANVALVSINTDVKDKIASFTFDSLSDDQTYTFNNAALGSAQIDQGTLTVGADLTLVRSGVGQINITAGTNVILQDSDGIATTDVPVKGIKRLNDIASDEIYLIV